MAISLRGRAKGHALNSEKREVCGAINFSAKF